MINLKNNKAVTLVMLIITIIVIFILAGISISMISGDEGVINRAEETVNQNKRAEDREKLEAAIIKLLETNSMITKDDLKVKLGWSDVAENGTKIECTSPNGNKFIVDKYGEIE